MQARADNGGRGKWGENRICSRKSDSGNKEEARGGGGEQTHTHFSTKTNTDHLTHGPETV